MCSPQTILDTVVGKIADAVIQSVVRHVRFVTRYKENLKNLDAEKKILEDQWGKINEEIKKAEILGEDIYAHVTNWLTEANKMRQEVEDFMNPETVKENMQCFAISCPDYISRYQLSKQIEKKIGDVKNLTQKGKYDKVSNPKPPPQELQFPSSMDSVSLDYMTFDSRESVFKRIMNALQDSKVYRIGVYGIGGVGKTTMVKEVCKQVKKDGLFDEVVMAVVSQDANVSQIQLQLVGDLNPKPADVEKATNEHERAKLLWPRLNNGKKNLIILDDIWKELNLPAIGIPITDENKGCKVVITTRNRDVWKNMHIDKEIPIQELSQPEAWDLFKKKVGNSVDSDQELHDIAVKVCKECQGLPVAILAVGAALKDKKKYAWENALKKLKKSMLKKIEGIDPRLYTSLKLSYDLLESMDAKSCFLLCCLFPEDVEISIDDLVRHCIARRLLDQKPDTLKEARDTVRTVVYTLKSCCLLLDGSNEYVVKMHDVIRDVAISIAEDEKAFMVKHGVQKWPEKSTCESSSAISLKFETIHKLPNDLVCPQLHTLTLLLTQYINPRLYVPDMFFSGMEKLTVLELNRIHMLRLPSSLANLVNLRMLYLIYCRLEDIAILKDLKNNLEILSLRGSSIKVLPSEIGQLTRLQLLDLGNCKQLTEIPQGVLSNLSRLEELYMLDGSRQWEPTTIFEKERSNVSLVELSKLTQLSTLEIQIPNVMLLPKDLCFKSLERFKISMGYGFELNEYYSRIFKCKGVCLRDEFNVLLEGAEVLDLKNLEGLQEMHHDIGGEGFLMQSYRLHTSTSFIKLTILRIHNCELKYLFSPSCARGLLQLQELNVQNCKIMEEIVAIEGEKNKEKLTSQVIKFSQLKLMVLSDLPKLISFYPKMEKATTSDGNSSTQSLFNEKVDFPLLEVLNIFTLPNITEIWDKQLLTVPQKESNSFCQLQSMTVAYCDNMMNVVRSNMLPRLQNLKSLDVTGCRKMEAIVLEKAKEKEVTDDDIIAFPQLITLHLQILRNLKSFCSWPTTRSEAQPLFNHQVDFPLLELLEITELPNITEIWDKQLLTVPEKESNSFCQLQSMTVSYCNNMMNVVRSNMLPRLQNLKSLTVMYCPKTEVIVLEKAKEKEATNEDINVFPQLINLYLHSLKSFCSWPTRSEAQSLFNHQVAFPKLEELCLDDCVYSKEKHLWNVLVSDISLEVLKVEQYDRSRSIFVRNYGRVTEVFQLERLNVGEREVQHQHGRPLLMEVRMMKLYSLPQLTCLWNKDPREILGFQNLQYLVIKKCSLLRNLFKCSTAKTLQQLKVVYLESCMLMEQVIATDEEGHKEEMIDDDEIEFPKLERLILKDLPNLNSFCNSENCNFNFPSLKRVVLKKCMKMQTFTSGQVRMSQVLVMVSTRGNKGIQTEDLNKYLIEQPLLKGKESATMDENDYEEGDYSEGEESDY